MTETQPDKKMPGPAPEGSRGDPVCCKNNKQFDCVNNTMSAGEKTFPLAGCHHLRGVGF